MLFIFITPAASFNPTRTLKKCLNSKDQIVRVMKKGFTGFIRIVVVPVLSSFLCCSCGGDHDNAPEPAINQAITQSVDAAMSACDGYFLFDMIHLKNKNQWQYVKTGIDSYLRSIAR
jgi:hypothetical protein